jgi:hypothetical protein
VPWRLLELGELPAHEVTALESALDVALELARSVNHELRRLLVERIVRVGLLGSAGGGERPRERQQNRTNQEKRIAKEKEAKRTRKRVTRPKRTEPRLRTGIQSARRMLRQT